MYCLSFLRKCVARPTIMNPVPRSLSAQEGDRDRGEREEGHTGNMQEGNSPESPAETKLDLNHKMEFKKSDANIRCLQ